MTTADAGSVTSNGSSAGTPDTHNAGADNGSAAAASPFAGLQDEGTRTWVEKKGYKSVEDLAKAAVNSESLLGSSVRRPADDAPKEEWDKFRSKLGRPEKPDAYEFKRPEGLPSELPYDETLAGDFKKWAHGAGLDNRQAQTLHDAFAVAQAEKVKEHMTQMSKAVEESAETLVKEWGPQDSEGFKRNHELANRAIKKHGALEIFKEKGLILPDGAIADARIAKIFASIGEEFSEDTIDGGDAPGGRNPFDKKKGTFNLSQITALVKSDPEKARRLASQAGENPDHWVTAKK